MRKRLIFGLFLGAFLGTSIGCRGVCGQGRMSPQTARADLLFDAFPSPEASENARSDWPQTVANDHPFEDIRYREVLINQQGRFGTEEDRPYRRFESVREGRIHR